MGGGVIRWKGGGEEDYKVDVKKLNKSLLTDT